MSIRNLYHIIIPRSLRQRRRVHPSPNMPTLHRNVLLLPILLIVNLNNPQIDPRSLRRSHLCLCLRLILCLTLTLTLGCLRRISTPV